MYSTEQLTQRWEDQRAIKNLMGKYANTVLLNREQEVFPRFWSEDGPTLAFNDGVYRGAAAVKAYYDVCRDRNALVAGLLQKRFPERLGGMSEEEIYGIGPFKVMPLYCPIIEVAGDGKTAKGLWFCQGAKNDVEACGPRARWTLGWFAADFRKEADGWKIWHMQYVNDVDGTCGQSWGREAVVYPDLPEFAPLKDFAYPAYTETKTVRAYYTPDRPITEAPAIPEPYETFADTFSYAV